MIHKISYAAGLFLLAAPGARAITVSVPEKSQPESITLAPNGDLILGSAANPPIYRATKGCSKAAIFIDVSADGGGSSSAFSPTHPPILFGDARFIRWYGERTGDRATSMPLPR